MKRTWAIAVVCIALVAVGGGIVWFILSSGAKPDEHTMPSESTPIQESSASVTIKDFAYSPATIRVKKGTTVTWTNEDTTRHNVISRVAVPMGPPTTHDLLAKGETYNFTFMATGTFDYGCTPHPKMKGTVEVVD